MKRSITSLASKMASLPMVRYCISAIIMTAVWCTSKCCLTSFRPPCPDMIPSIIWQMPNKPS